MQSQSFCKLDWIVFPFLNKDWLHSMLYRNLNQLDSYHHLYVYYCSMCLRRLNNAENEYSFYETILWPKKFTIDKSKLVTPLHDFSNEFNWELKCCVTWYSASYLSHNNLVCKQIIPFDLNTLIHAYVLI